MDMTMTSTAMNISNNMVTRNGMDIVKSRNSSNSKKTSATAGTPATAWSISNSMVTSHSMDNQKQFRSASKIKGLCLICLLSFYLEEFFYILGHFAALILFIFL
jgi:hypothetical protein